MIGADVYVSDALLDKYNDNEKVKQEKDDRSTMEVFLTDNDVRRTIVDNAQLSQRNKEVLQHLGHNDLESGVQSIESTIKHARVKIQKQLS